MMFLTKKVYQWEENQYFGEGTDAPEKVMITLENASDNIPKAIGKFILAMPMLYLIVMLYDAAIAHHLQYDLSMAIIILELVYLVPKKSLFLKAVDLPMLVFNTIAFHPIASYGYAVTVPLDIIALVFTGAKEANKTAKEARQANANDRVQAQQTQKPAKVINAEIVKEHH